MIHFVFELIFFSVLAFFVHGMVTDKEEFMEHIASELEKGPQIPRVVSNSEFSRLVRGD